jgi:hypothetical protein
MFKIKGLSKEDRAVKLMWLSALLALVCGLIALVSQHFAAELFGWSSTVYRERHELTPNRHITINSADIPLEVYTYDGDTVIVEYIGETPLIIIDDELELRISRVEDFTLSLFSLDRLNYKMQIWLPGDYFEHYDEIRLFSASGDIYAENIRTLSLTATSRNGNVTLVGIEGEIAVDTRFGE